MPSSPARRRCADRQSDGPGALPRPVASVAIVDLEQRRASAAARDIGPKHRGYGCNVADPAACQELIERTLADFGKIDILVNYAGVSQPDRLMEVTQENYDR